MGKFDKPTATDTAADAADTTAAGAIEGAGAALEAGGNGRDVAAATIGGAAAATAEVTDPEAATNEEAPVEADPVDEAIATWMRKVARNSPLSRSTAAYNHVVESLPLLKSLLKGEVN